MGYFNDPVRTREKFAEDGTFHSGDLGYIEDDGYIYFVCRMKGELTIQRRSPVGGGYWLTSQCNNANIKYCIVVGHVPVGYPAEHITSQSIVYRPYSRVITAWLVSPFDSEYQLA